MSYRKITVNDKQYQYVVGKVNTKIVDVGVFKNHEIGELDEIEGRCDCCGEPLSQIYSSHINRTAWSVKPRNVAEVIKAHIFGKTGQALPAGTSGRKYA